MTSADRQLHIIVAAAHDLNNEMTIQVSALTLAIRATPLDSPIRPLLLEARASLQRSMWTASGLLNYGARKGARGRASLDYLLQEAQF